MILLNLLIILLSIVIVLHLIKFLKERNKKREGFIENNIEAATNMGDIGNMGDVALTTPDLHGEILKKMKESNANKNKDAIINDTKTQEEIDIEISNKNIVNELKNDIKEMMNINEDVKKLNESFKSRMNE
jgi:hypothetical protein